MEDTKSKSVHSVQHGSLRGQYQSLSQDEEHEVQRTEIAPSTFSIEMTPRESQGVGLGSKKRNVWYIVGGSLLVLGILAILSFSVMTPKSVSREIDLGSAQANKKRSDDDTPARSPLSYMFEECRSHCRDPCVSTPIKHGHSLCCDWVDTVGGSQTCAQTFTKDGQCFCSATALNSFTDRTPSAPPTHVIVADDDDFSKKQNSSGSESEPETPTEPAPSKPEPAPTPSNPEPAPAPAQPAEPEPQPEPEPASAETVPEPEKSP